MSVAERLYYDDSFLRTFSARVTDIREYARIEGQSHWQVALDRTAFYPTSGGQPHDCGTLSAVARSGAELVAEVDEVIEADDGEVWHSTRKPLLAGTDVTGTIDWARRLGHTQQHSGQHLLSAVLDQQLGAKTVSFHLGEETSSIDLAAETPKEQTRILQALTQTERLANEHIAADLPVSVRTVSAEEAQALLRAGKVRKLPPREGPIRLVEIPGLDLNACGGTHVRALGQIGSLLIRGTERLKKGVRIEFVCGLRSVATARKDFESLTSAATTLTVGRDSVATAVERLLRETKATAKTHAKVLGELANHHAVQLAVEERIENGLRLVHRTFADRDAEYIRLLASKLVAAVPQTAAVFLSTQQEPASLVLACSKSLACRCGERVRNALAPLGLRGGGSADLAQVSLPRAQAEQVAKQLIMQLSAEMRTQLQ